MGQPKKPNRNKVRRVAYLEPKQDTQLLALSAKTGATPTELMRRALAEYLKKREGK